MKREKVRTEQWDIKGPLAIGLMEKIKHQYSIDRLKPNLKYRYTMQDKLVDVWVRGRVLLIKFVAFINPEKW